MGRLLAVVWSESGEQRCLARLLPESLLLSMGFHKTTVNLLSNRKGEVTRLRDKLDSCGDKESFAQVCAMKDLAYVLCAPAQAEM
jgi:hypothetical protein